MRPTVLYPLFAPLTALGGVGTRMAVLLERLAGPKVVDLLWHLPTGLIDRRFAPKVAEAPEGGIATLLLHVDGHEPGGSPRRPYRVRCRDETGFLHLVFFHAREDHLRRLLPEGAEVAVSGRIEHFGGLVQITHPDHVVPAAELAEIQGVEPVYPLTAGVRPKMLRKTIQAALERAPELPEWLSPAMVARHAWPSWRRALAGAHAPEGEDDLSPLSFPRQRLAYDELLANQLALGLVRAKMRELPGRSLAGDGGLRARILAALPFSLTSAQARAVEEIAADMARPSRMLRLLQGDVGSGKTVVALLAMAAAVESGAQAAMMAPTEILARQHLDSLAPWAEAAGLRLGLLTGRDKGKARARLLEALAAGEIDILLGTHALFQDDVVFRDLGLAVIDEQHRFGVHQRLSLSGKGAAADMLVMTATPIPRTLTLTAYGDMDSSRLDDKPPGRKPVDTRTLPLSRLDEVVEGLHRGLAAGARAYWICPLVEESEASDLAAAEQRHIFLTEALGRTESGRGRVGLVHGKMKSPDKDAAMAAFVGGATDVLVATTVIEVGVNVPEATIMVVEHAERFGLAQLHQLRGRIGRGDKASTCLLLYGAPLGETARARLSILRETEDGFRIAEEDLRLRGAGEMLGTRQSGLPEFRLADPLLHGDLLEAARAETVAILNEDPELTGPRGQSLRTLLYLFERDAAARCLRSG